MGGVAQKDKSGEPAGFSRSDQDLHPGDIDLGRVRDRDDRKGTTPGMVRPFPGKATEKGYAVAHLEDRP